MPETFARILESSLLGSVSAPLYPFVRVTEDDFERPQTGERRGFVVVGVQRGSRLHQVTAGGDYRFYRSDRLSVGLAPHGRPMASLTTIRGTRSALPLRRSALESPCAS